MIPKEIRYNLHYDYVRGDFLRPLFFLFAFLHIFPLLQRGPLNGMVCSKKPFLFDWTLFLEGKKILKSCLRWTCVIPLKP